jgi:CDP-diacylglycerol---serine O-phosphatidyltransferase
MKSVLRAPVHDLHVSNLLTYASLAAATGAVAASLGGGGLPAAGALLAVAALSDTFDGAFARRFVRNLRQRQVGGELDSLVDAIAFGLAPVVVLTTLSDRPSGLVAGWWWCGAFAYVGAAVTRLGFYNVEQDEAHFVGIPTPAAALIWSTVLLWDPPVWLVAVLLYVCAAAMIAPLPIPRPKGAALGAFGLWAVLLVARHIAVW